MKCSESVWRCPSCQSLLSLQNASWRCEQGHCFDVAKEGYVNLLLAQQKNSKQPGDNKAMVNARRNFLEQGFYQPIADTLASLVAEYFTELNSADKQQLRFFDAGCGEGYYLNQISHELAKQGLDCVFSGVDISKNAVLKAAKKYTYHQFAVASTFHIPVPSDSQYGVLQIFAPSSSDEIHRVLKPEGIWITVNPAPKHLFELKQALYDQPAEHTENEQHIDGFELKHATTVSFELDLTTSAQRENLLMMTPYYWTASEDKKQRLLDSLTQVTTDFDIRVWRKA